MRFRKLTAFILALTISVCVGMLGTLAAVPEEAYASENTEMLKQDLLSPLGDWASWAINLGTKMLLSFKGALNDTAANTIGSDWALVGSASPEEAQALVYFSEWAQMFPGGAQAFTVLSNIFGKETANMMAKKAMQEYFGDEIATALAAFDMSEPALWRKVDAAGRIHNGAYSMDELASVNYDFSSNLFKVDQRALNEYRTSAVRKAIIATAETKLGLPYNWNDGKAYLIDWSRGEYVLDDYGNRIDTTGTGLDCSGLVDFAYWENGIAVGYWTQLQYEYAPVIKYDVHEAKPGDILFKEGTETDHVAIYVGGDTYIEEPGSGLVCRYNEGIDKFDYVLVYIDENAGVAEYDEYMAAEQSRQDAVAQQRAEEERRRSQEEANRRAREWYEDQKAQQEMEANPLDPRNFQSDGRRHEEMRATPGSE